jgi:hypothetical protein
VHCITSGSHADDSERRRARYRIYNVADDGSRLHVEAVRAYRGGRFEAQA